MRGEDGSSDAQKNGGVPQMINGSNIGVQRGMVEPAWF